MPVVNLTMPATAEQRFEGAEQHVGSWWEDWGPLKLLIIERTEGNPFFMEETMQVLFDEGALERNGRLIQRIVQIRGEARRYNLRVRSID